MSTPTSNPKVNEIRQSLRSSYDELNLIIERYLTTLDPAMLYQTPAPTEWTLMENMAHIIEFMYYWADEIAKLVASPGKNFGRTQQHEGRLSAIRERGGDTLAQVRTELPGGYAYLDQILETLKDSDLDLQGSHSRFGDQTLDWFIKEFVTHHLANHVEQIKTSLEMIKAR